MTPNGPRNLGVAFALLCAQPAAWQPQHQEQFRSSASAATIAIGVVDGDGRFVPGLGADNFSIRVRGSLREIIDTREVGTAAVDAESSRDFILLFDRWTGLPRQLEFRQAYAAARDFLDHLGSGDRVAVVSHSALGAIAWHSDWSIDREVARDAISAVEALPTLARSSTRPPVRRGSLEALRAIALALAGSDQTRYVLFFSLGDNDRAFDSAGARERAIDTARLLRAARVVVHGFQPSGVPGSSVPAAVPGRPSAARPSSTRATRPQSASAFDGRVGFSYIASETGGTTWYFRHQLEEGVREVEERSRPSYLVTFAIAPDDAGVLPIDVEVRGNGVSLWWAPPEVSVLAPSR